MKKLFFTLSLLFALTIGANAQNSKVDPAVMAKKEVATLNELVGLTDQQLIDLNRLFVQKYTILADESYSTERKTEFLRVSEAKVQSTLTEAQLKQFLMVKEKYDAIISESQKSK